MTYVLNTWLYPDNVSSACTYNPIALFIRVLWVPKSTIKYAYATNIYLVAEILLQLALITNQSILLFMQ